MKYTLRRWIIPIVLFIGLFVVFVSCQKSLKDDIDDLMNRVSKLEKICEQVNSDITGLKQIVSALEANDYITGVNELADKSGYAINFLKGKTIVIKHGTNGECPVIGVDAFEGIFYWTQKIGDNSPSWILDSQGNRIQATGVNGVTPVIAVNKNGNWTVDYGKGAQEIKVDGKPVPARGKNGMNGVDGKDGYSPFESVTDKGDHVEIRLTTGVVLKLLKWDEKMMKIVFDLNGENLISDVMYLNEEKTVSYSVENPDPQASVYFETTNGWTVEHNSGNKTITIMPYAAWDYEGRIIASVIKGNKLISQFRFLVKTNMLQQPLDKSDIKAEPQPLENIGGKVPVTINMTFPVQWFPKEAVITVTPVLRYAGGEAMGTFYTYQGEKVNGNNQVVPYEEGANVTMKSAFDNKPEMKKSELFLTFEIMIKGKKYTIPDVKIGEGVIAAS